jgi:hypothetical protein
LPEARLFHVDIDEQENALTLQTFRLSADVEMALQRINVTIPDPIILLQDQKFGVKKSGLH